MPMGKKGCTNPKAIAAREREREKKEREKERLIEQQEQAKWADDDKHVARKQQRKAQKEEKRINDLTRKQNIKKLAEEELESMNAKSIVKQPYRVTRSEIEKNIQKTGPIGSSTGVIRQTSVNSDKSNRFDKNSSVAADSDDEIFDIPENINRLADDEIHAKNVDEAIDVLSELNLSDKRGVVDRHPEKRRAAAFKAYREKEMIRLKAENPRMTFSQKEQLIFKNWQKSPENPIVQSKLNAPNNPNH